MVACVTTNNYQEVGHRVPLSTLAVSSIQRIKESHPTAGWSGIRTWDLRTIVVAGQNNRVFENGDYRNRSTYQHIHSSTFQPEQRGKYPIPCWSGQRRRRKLSVQQARCEQGAGFPLRAQSLRQNNSRKKPTLTIVHDKRSRSRSRGPSYLFHRYKLRGRNDHGERSSHCKIRCYCCSIK